MRVKSLNLLKDLEGYEETAYRDLVGVLTIGYGRTANVQPGQTTTREFEDAWLQLHMQELCQWVDRIVEPPLNVHQREALAIWVYNLGKGSLQESTLLKRLNAGAFKEVDYEWLRWVHAGGEMRDGLVIRRAKELCLWRWDVIA